jgi:hypothetical protein
MNRIRNRLSFANVASTVAVFAVLATGTAFAASLDKDSVGAPQLKKNAVTTAKLKKNAVTKAKIKNGAVNGPKIADGSIGATELNLADAPFSRVVARLRSTATVAVPPGPAYVQYPFGNGSYVQGADELNLFYGAVSVAFDPACTAPRAATVYVLSDPKNALVPTEQDVAAVGQIQDLTGTNSAGRVDLGAYPGLGGHFEPGVPTTRNLVIVALGQCKSGAGITLSDAAIDVIGIR